MPQQRLPRRGLVLALGFALSPILFAPADTKPAVFESQEFQGKVAPLAGWLEQHGARLDADAAPHWLALVTGAGKAYPLVKDDGSRMFFKDSRLLNRPMRLTARLLPDTHLLQVLEVRSVSNGALHDVYYWCDVCTIRRSEKMICECCGGPMDLREPPLGK